VSLSWIPSGMKCTSCARPRRGQLRASAGAEYATSSCWLHVAPHMQGGHQRMGGPRGPSTALRPKQGQWGAAGAGLEVVDQFGDGPLQPSQGVVHKAARHALPPAARRPRARAVPRAGVAAPLRWELRLLVVFKPLGGGGGRQRAGERAAGPPSKSKTPCGEVGGVFWTRGRGRRECWTCRGCGRGRGRGSRGSC
jgi:hypothetical protein